MNRILIASAAIVSLLTTSAFAADLAPRPYTKAPVIVDPGYNWTGFYVGLNGGYSWGRARNTFEPGAPLGITTFGQNVDGGLGGAQIGYNWQLDRTWVVGLEADIQGTGERGGSRDQLGSIRVGNIGATLFADTTTSLPWFATFRARGGVLVDPSLLLYATGGLAVGEVKAATTPTGVFQLFDGNSNVTIGAPFTVTGATVSGSETRVGWTVGAGLEKKFARNWSAKLEYLYMDFGSKTYFGGTANQTTVKFHDHVARVGINYHFTAAPVVAKY
ncbi:porin family protein [Bradyrhizobium sp. AUGA SZCCT0274]|uniref:outer membrane protein n=1 Tax=unclassified Bradyrhizobium TaxID=2631580 RepID=UPI001BAC7904|nr:MULTISPECIES: outer membrane protein [unclassified Bradyrhizobium]MBR1194872.1 porin family protein [Bradyrhizobium sp. AUGA SZCCT0158]MBR1242988.1 porin family protein [Bradyrhizobium sp. AUGA SZCCT0274]